MAEAQAGGQSEVYKVSARATQRNPVLEKTKQTNKKQNKQKQQQKQLSTSVCICKVCMRI